MRTPVAVALALSGAVVMALAPAPALAAKRKPLPGCAAEKSTTLEQSKDARVYQVGDKVYACRFKKNRRVLLGTDECMTQIRASRFTLKGRYVGWVATSCGLVSGTSSIQVTNLDTGRLLHGASAAVRTANGTDGTQETNTYISDYVMKANGSVAWIGVYGNDGTTTVDSPADEVQVRRLQAGSPSGGELVDQGQTVVLESLGLAKDGFYYRKGATPLFAPLG